MNGEEKKTSLKEESNVIRLHTKNIGANYFPDGSTLWYFSQSLLLLFKPFVSSPYFFDQKKSSPYFGHPILLPKNSSILSGKTPELINHISLVRLSNVVRFKTKTQANEASIMIIQNKVKLARGFQTRT